MLFLRQIYLMFLPGVEPVMIRFSPTGGNFFVSVKTFDANIDNIGNFVLTVKIANNAFQR